MDPNKRIASANAPALAAAIAPEQDAAAVAPEGRAQAQTGRLGRAAAGQSALAARPDRAEQPLPARDRPAVAQVRQPRGKDLSRLLAARPAAAPEPGAEPSPVRSIGKDFGRLQAVLLHDRPAADGESAAPPEKRMRLHGAPTGQSHKLHLPTDVAGSILTSVMPETGANATMTLLDALSTASPSMRAALIRDGHLRHKYRLLQEVSQAAGNLLAADRNGFCPWHALLTHLLSPDDLERLIAGAVQSNKVGAMGEHFEHLSAAQRSQLVERALTLPLEQRSRQLEGLIKGLAHFTPEQRDAVVDEVLGSHLIGLPAKKGLAEVMEHLTPAQRSRTLSALDDFTDPASKGDYVSTLVARLALLQPAERQFLVDSAIGMKRFFGYQQRGNIFGAIASQAGDLDPTQRTAIVTAAITDSSINARAQAMAGLARGANALTEAERERLVTAVLALPQGARLSQVLEGCGESAGSFNEHQRSQLIHALTHLADWQKPAPIEAFSKSSAHLTEEDRTQLNAIARSMTSPSNKAAALASLGFCDEAFSVLRNGITPADNDDIPVWGDRALARLCERVERLSPENRQQLIDMMGRFDWLFRGRGVERMTEQLSHLNEAQRHMVKDMVLRLDDCPHKAILMSKLGHGINAMRPEPQPD